MKIIAVDDEQKALNSVLRVLREVEPEADVAPFTDPQEAFTYLSENKVDVALLDIKMGGLTGMELAEKCKSLCPTVNIIFVTGYSRYTMAALRLHVSGYLMKPVRSDDLRAELSNLRHPLPRGKRVRIQTFGNFEVFVDGKPLYIPIAKCRECLAYLVDRKGASVATAELAAVLWEDAPKDRRMMNNTYRVIVDLMKLLKQTGIAEIVIKTRKDMAIDTEQVDCDFYRFLQGDASGVGAFHGEYMTNYSWAEFTLVQLSRRKT